MTLAGYNLQDNVYIYSNNKCMCVFLISPVPIAEPLTSELIDTPVFYNLAPRPIKYRVSVPIPNGCYLGQVSLVLNLKESSWLSKGQIKTTTNGVMCESLLRSVFILMGSTSSVAPGHRQHEWCSHLAVLRRLIPIAFRSPSL